MAITNDGYHLGGTKVIDMGNCIRTIYNLKLDGSATTFTTGYERIIDARIGAFYWDESGEAIDLASADGRTIAVAGLSEGDGTNQPGIYNKLTFTLTSDADDDEIIVDVIGY